MRSIVLLARPSLVGGRREFLSIRLEDFRSLYLMKELVSSPLPAPGRESPRRLDNKFRSWACSVRSMVDECRS
jgi:hypothetical protein